MDDAIMALNHKKNLNEIVTKTQRNQIDKQINEILTGSKLDPVIVIANLTDTNVYYLERCGYLRQSEDTFVFGRTAYVATTGPVVQALKNEPLQSVLKLISVYLFVAIIRLVLGY
jgi:hypothetical protein